MTGWSLAQLPEQRGVTVLITGANSGLGLRSAEAMAGAGARVLLACRNPTKGSAALELVRAKATGEPPELVALDLSDQGSIATAAKDIADRVERLDISMNNAGIMAVPLARNAQGWEMQFATNHLGHFALTARVSPLLLAADAPRVVTTSSQAHRPGSLNFDDLHWSKRYSKWLAYSRSKLANLLFAFELDRRARAADRRLCSVAAHPGYASTHLQAAGPELAGRQLVARIMGLGNRLLAQSDADGALPQLYAATMPDVQGGEYFGPKGAFEQKGPPVRVRAKQAAYNVETARRLWDVSEQLTGLDFRLG